MFLGRSKGLKFSCCQCASSGAQVIARSFWDRASFVALVHGDAVSGGVLPLGFGWSSARRSPALEARARLHIASPRGRARLRERVGVEHKLAHLVRRQGRRARYRGVRENRSASAIQYLEAIQRKVA